VARAKAERRAFEIGGFRVEPGTSATVELPISRLSTRLPMSLSVRVVHGRRMGPVFFTSAAVHGDEVMGVEIIRRLLQVPALEKLAGTLICAPIVNVFGFLAHTRYLPDRRDLNRSFPGSAAGSLASRLAHVFRTEVLERAHAGVDIHTAALHRTNLPQIRITPGRPRLERLADAFAPPVIIESALREGSLREAAAARDIDVLVYEAGEALRFDELSIRVGVQGILRVMAELGMVSPRGLRSLRAKPVRSASTTWVRAPESGIFRALKRRGQEVVAGEAIGLIGDPLGDVEIEVKSPVAGIVIGRTNLPVVYQGDALLHIAEVLRPDAAAGRIETIANGILGAPLFDEDEII
jgi:predicted deacylase